VRHERFLNVYAIHSYRGRSQVELSAVRAVGHLRPSTEGIPDTPPGFDAVTPLRIYVRDGQVAVYCGQIQQNSRDLPADIGRIWPPRGGVEITGVTFIAPAWE
jgi:hypothetical protein